MKGQDRNTINQFKEIRAISILADKTSADSRTNRRPLGLSSLGLCCFIDPTIGGNLPAHRDKGFGYRVPMLGTEYEPAHLSVRTGRDALKPAAMPPIKYIDDDRLDHFTVRVELDLPAGSPIQPVNFRYKFREGPTNGQIISVEGKLKSSLIKHGLREPRELEKSRVFPFYYPVREQSWAGFYF